ncbi:hypothetical protein NKI54_00835 [Mesorhizobium sp. M0663]|uniref:hypothetical protein n=1 Tax=unclassified Mesorhizobium TaxID=325217 RepID=UPI00333AE1C4
MQEIVKAIFDHWAIVTANPQFFIGLMTAALALGFAAGRFHYRERLETLKSTNDDFARQLADLRHEPKLGTDQDAIVQHGMVVAKGVGVTPQLGDGVCLFERIEGNGEFNHSASFSYRGTTMRIQTFMNSAEGNFGAMRTQLFSKVTAELV